MLAVTRKMNGICIAGVTNDLKWVRPVKSHILSLEDIKSDKDYLSISKVYDFSFIKHVPDSPQTENHLIDEAKQITHVKTLNEDERLALFQGLQENSLITSNNNLGIATVLKNNNRSLILLGPVTIESVHMYYQGSHMKSPDITFKIDSLPVKNQRGNDLSCTDLKFRAFAKDLLKKKKLTSLRLTGNELKEVLKFDKIFVAIGLTGKFRDEYWPMVIGLHTVPDYKQEVDYGNL